MSYGKRRCPHCGRMVYETDPVCPSCNTACHVAVKCRTCGMKYGHDVEAHRMLAQYQGIKNWVWGKGGTDE